MMEMQQFPLWEKTQVVAAISQSRKAFYATRCTRFGNRDYKTAIADGNVSHDRPGMIRLGRFYF